MCSFVELSSNISTASSPVISSTDSTNRASPSYKANGQQQNQKNFFGSLVDKYPQQNSKKCTNLEETNDLLVENANFSTNFMFYQQSTRERNGKNSLAQLCRRFLMVLLCNPVSKKKFF